MIRNNNTRLYRVRVGPDLRAAQSVSASGSDSATDGTKIHIASIVSEEAMAGSSSSRPTSKYGEHALIGDDPSKTTLQKHTTYHKYLHNKYSDYRNLCIAIIVVNLVRRYQLSMWCSAGEQQYRADQLSIWCSAGGQQYRTDQLSMLCSAEGQQYRTDQLSMLCSAEGKQYRADQLSM